MTLLADQAKTVVFFLLFVAKGLDSILYASCKSGSNLVAGRVSHLYSANRKLQTLPSNTNSMKPDNNSCS